MGPLTIYSPMYPELDFELDLSMEENRKWAKLVITLAVIEVGRVINVIVVMISLV